MFVLKSFYFLLAANVIPFSLGDEFVRFWCVRDQEDPEEAPEDGQPPVDVEDRCPTKITSYETGGWDRYHSPKCSS